MVSRELRCAWRRYVAQSDGGILLSRAWLAVSCPLSFAFLSFPCAASLMEFPMRTTFLPTLLAVVAGATVPGGDAMARVMRCLTAWRHAA
ncbi:hypothetical protein GXY_00079 [Novacetimonas hansenii ATCC 23769]|uniref:Uncharacterized protein n=1 Tax=Novacetimonas hansenii ATCC 23769 TaxID=714995 RepID=D5QA81_NOVHA|nr:hypothetical protein GXY_00079 [Novacetimonas hansenii ATCC 23769]RFP02309.1 hypothetical protein BGC30_04505 [Novacetimonas hansenii]